MASQAEQWFKLADQDGDGAVGGAEAVRFFTRSGLPQDVLGQVGPITGILDLSASKSTLQQHIASAHMFLGKPSATQSVASVGQCVARLMGCLIRACSAPATAASNTGCSSCSRQACIGARAAAGSSYPSLVWETGYAHDHFSSSSHDIWQCTSPVLLHAAADLGVRFRWCGKAEPYAVQHSTQAGVTGAGELLQQPPALTASLSSSHVLPAGFAPRNTAADLPWMPTRAPTDQSSDLKSLH